MARIVHVLQPADVRLLQRAHTSIARLLDSIVPANEDLAPAPRRRRRKARAKIAPRLAKRRPAVIGGALAEPVS